MMIQNTSKQTLATQKLCISQLLLLAIGSENDTRSTDSKLKHKNTFNIRHFNSSSILPKLPKSYFSPTSLLV